MQKFNIDDYRGSGYVMHCDTKAKADIFLRYLDSCGEKWIGGESYLVEDCWKVYRENTCYAFNTGQYGHYGFLTDPALHTILEFDDFVWDKHRSLDSQQLYEIWDRIHF